MTIHSAQAFVAGLWDWACLDGCFGQTRIAVSDMDGYIERNGKLLMLETKQAGVTIPLGQKIAFQNLARTGIVTTFVVWGASGRPEQVQAFYSERPLGSAVVTCDMDKLRRLVSTWYQEASQ